MSEGILNQSKFADLAGVSRAAVGQAIKDGLLVLNEKKKLDLSHKRQKAYLKRHQAEPTKPQDHTDRIRRGKYKKGIDKGLPPEKIITDILDGETKKVKSKTTQTELDMDKYQMEVKKGMEQIKRLQIATARDLRKMIPIEEIEGLFHKQYSIVVSHFHPVGFRVTETIMGILGITDPGKALEVEKIITDEIMLGIDEYKKALYIEPAIEN